MLGELRRQWAPEAFVVSFKLETDSQILIQKVFLAPGNKNNRRQMMGSIFLEHFKPVDTVSYRMRQRAYSESHLKAIRGKRIGSLKT